MRTKLVVLVSLLLVLTGSACRDGGTLPAAETPPPAATVGTDGSPTVRAEEPEVTASSPTETEESTSVEVWMAGPNGLLASRRTVPATAAVGRAAMEQLLAGPSHLDVRAGMATAIPSGTTLLDLDIAGGTATVDLSEDFASGGGSTSMRMRVAQVVFTLTQFPTVSDVEFRMNGEPVGALGGEGLLIEGGQTRAGHRSQLAPIVVLEPAPGDPVASGFELGGSANVFEATVSYRLVSRGEVLAEGFTTATCGSGCRGRFRTSVDFAAAGLGRARLEVFESSAEDGSPLHMVTIPLRLQP